MRIGIFTDDYYPRFHGVITSIATAKRELEKQGHEVFIIAPSEPGYEDTEPGVIRTPSITFPFSNKGRLGFNYPGLADKLAKYNFDVVHSHTPFTMGLLAFAVSQRLGIPNVHTMHTVYPELLDQYPVAVYSGLALASVVYPLFFRHLPKVDRQILNEMQSPTHLVKDSVWRVNNIFLEHTDAVVAPSQHLADALRAHHLKTPCYVIPNGVDIENIQKFVEQPLAGNDLPRKAQGDIWITAVGRLSREKRQETLIRAIAASPHKHVKLVLVGDGPSKDELTDLVDELHVVDRVLFAGRQPQNVVMQLLAKSDVFTLASYGFDNQPMVILEAAAVGLPILYCDPKLTEGVESTNAIMAKNPEVDGFISAIELIVAEPKKLIEMGEASKKIAQDYSAKRQAERLIALYESLQRTTVHQPVKEHIA